MRSSGSTPVPLETPHLILNLTNLEILRFNEAITIFSEEKEQSLTDFVSKLGSKLEQDRLAYQKLKEKCQHVLKAHSEFKLATITNPIITCELILKNKCTQVIESTIKENKAAFQADLQKLFEKEKDFDKTKESYRTLVNEYQEKIDAVWKPSIDSSKHFKYLQFSIHQTSSKLCTQHLDDIYQKIKDDRARALTKAIEEIETEILDNEWKVVQTRQEAQRVMDLKGDVYSYINGKIGGDFEDSEFLLQFTQSIKQVIIDKAEQSNRRQNPRSFRKEILASIPKEAGPIIHKTVKECLDQVIREKADFFIIPEEKLKELEEKEKPTYVVSPIVLLDPTKPERLSLSTRWTHLNFWEKVGVIVAAALIISLVVAGIATGLIAAVGGGLAVVAAIGQAVYSAATFTGAVLLGGATIGASTAAVTTLVTVPLLNSSQPTTEPPAEKTRLLVGNRNRKSKDSSYSKLVSRLQITLNQYRSLPNPPPPHISTSATTRSSTRNPIENTETRRLKS